MQRARGVKGRAIALNKEFIMSEQIKDGINPSEEAKRKSEGAYDRNWSGKVVAQGPAAGGSPDCGARVFC